MPNKSIMNVKERWLSGRKRPPAKWVRYFSTFSGSNPDLSATYFLRFIFLFLSTASGLVFSESTSFATVWNTPSRSLQSTLWYLPKESALPYYKTWIQRCNKRLEDHQSAQIAAKLIQSCMQHGIDARLMVAIIKVESDFNPKCVSRKGAMGLGQLMPINVLEMGVQNPFDPLENLESTVRMVKGHLVYYLRQTRNIDEALPLALAAYNAGSGAVKRFRGIPPYKETQNYVRKVIFLYKQLAGIK